MKLDKRDKLPQLAGRRTGSRAKL